MEYVMVLCTVFALIYGDINAMVEQGGNENKTLLTEVCEEEEKAGVDERFANLSDEEKENEWFGSVLNQNLAKFIKYFAVNGIPIASFSSNTTIVAFPRCDSCIQPWQPSTDVRSDCCRRAFAPTGRKANALISKKSVNLHR